MSAIQFNNLQSVLLAFQNRGVDAWALWQGKQFMFKGIGETDLKMILDSLENGATNAIYTLKVFEEIEDEKKIKSNTPDDGSFNFRLNSDRMELTQSAYTSAYSNAAIVKKLEEIEKRLDEDEVVEEKSGLGKIGEVLDHPVIAPLIPIVLEKVLTAIFSKNPVPQNQLNYQPAMALSGIDEDAAEKEVIEKLKKHDPQLLEHLSKLLEIAETNNPLFQVIIKSL